MTGAGTVTYMWERSDGSIAPVSSITFNGPDSQTVTTTWTLSASYAGWEQLHVLTPNDVTSNQARFTLDCPAITQARFPVVE
jgi:hypothetical protein